MATENANIRTFYASGAVTAYRCVKLGSTANYAAVCAATTDKIIGVALNSAADTYPVPVQMIGGSGTYKVEAGEVLSLGSAVYLIATAGKVGNAGSTSAKFLALEAATAAGDIIEVCNWIAL